jgi:hypothetical protein
LQERLVSLAVEKAALEKELEVGRGQMEQLQHKVRAKGGACDRVHASVQLDCRLLLLNA